MAKMETTLFEAVPESMDLGLVRSDWPQIIRIRESVGGPVLSVT